MTKKNSVSTGVTIMGKITIHGDMFNIHDNEHVHITYPEGIHQIPDDDFEYVDLEFFDTKLFGTYEHQLALRKILKEAFKRMALDTGRDLVAVYLAYHFLKGQLYIMQNYTGFIQDVDGLMPKMLPKVKEDEESRNQRYKSYIESLSTECEKWFIDNDCLPDITLWKSKEYKYKVDDSRRKRIQKLVTDIYQGMKDITR